MAEEQKLQNRIEDARVLKRLSLVVASAMLALALAVFFSGIFNNFVPFDSYGLLVIVYLAGMILALNAAFRGYFDEKAVREEEDRELFEKRKEKMVLEAGEDVLFQSARMLKNYRRFAPHVVSFLNIILIGSLLYVFWRYWGKRPAEPEYKNVLECAFAIGLLGVISLFGGVFCVGQSREKGFGWLRAPGAWLILAFVLGAISAAGAVSLHFGHPGGVAYARSTSFFVLMILCAELFVNSIMEFYRPRTAFEGQPVFESRLLAFLTEPGGVARNIADTLDYQFGFKITKREIYVFAANSIIPLALVWLVALWLLTCLSEVKPGEVGTREIFGRRIECAPLDSGVYFKLPWPFERIATFPVYEIREVVVQPVNPGEAKKEGQPKAFDEKLVLWTNKHSENEPRFIVAAEKDASGGEVPVSLIAASFPIQYRIKKDEVVKFAYGYRDAEHILKAVAEKEITKYLVSIDMLKAMSVDRWKVKADLTKNIQDAADRMELGIEIVTVNFSDVHPPADEVAPSFQEVVGALEEKETKILNAKSYEIKTRLSAESQSRRILAEAKTDSEGKIKLAEAEKQRFEKQLAAYRLMPEMFRLRNFLDFFENDCRNIRKVVVAGDVPNSVYIINLEEKARLDLGDTDIVSLTEPEKPAAAPSAPPPGPPPP